MNITAPGRSSFMPAGTSAVAMSMAMWGVVPAGVHDGDDLPLILGHFFGREGQPLWLLDRQRVHVGAQRDGATWLSTLEDADDAGTRHTRADFQFEAAQMLSDELRGPRLLVAKFRVLVDVSPPGDYLLFDGLDRFRTSASRAALSARPSPATDINTVAVNVTPAKDRA